MADLKALLARVEAATGPDREIDKAVGLLVDGWTSYASVAYGPMISTSDGDEYIDSPNADYPSFTESLDACMGLALRVVPKFWHSCMWNAMSETSRRGAYHMRFPKPGEEALFPLAFLAAILRLIDERGAAE